MGNPVYWALVPVSMTSSRVGVTLTFPDSRSRPGDGVLPHFQEITNSVMVSFANSGTVRASAGNGTAAPVED